jgi:hypothetical protein
MCKRSSIGRLEGRMQERSRKPGEQRLSPSVRLQTNGTAFFRPADELSSFSSFFSSLAGRLTPAYFLRDRKLQRSNDIRYLKRLRWQGCKLLMGWLQVKMTARGGALLKPTLLVATALTLTLAASAQRDPYGSNPREYVRTTIYNELHAHGNGEHFMWRSTEQKSKGITTKLMIETKEGVISRVIAINGHPLSAEERAQDDGRVNRLLSDPGALHKKQHDQKEEEEHAQNLMGSIPDAFVFSLVGVEDGKDGKLVHYTFVPDPKFNAPNREARMLAGMKGDLFIDMDAKRIAKIDATLFQNVEFGWGFLAKLDKGGRFLIEQKCVGPNRWEATHSVLRFNGKALLVKTIKIEEDETLFDFRPVKNDLTVAQGIEAMKKADDMVAQNGGGNGQ